MSQMQNKRDIGKEIDNSFDLEYIQYLKQKFNLTDYEAIMVFLKNCEVNTDGENEIVFHSILQELEDLNKELKRLADKL